MLYVISVPCTIEAQAYGANRHRETRYAYVKLNGVAVWHASWRGEYPVNRGVNVFIVDRSACTLQEWRNFDTHGDRYAAAQLRDYLQGLSDGTVLVGVSADEITTYFYAARRALSALGAYVSDVGWRGAFVFVAEKGDPSKTVVDKELTEAAAYGRQPKVNAYIAGTLHYNF